MKFLPLILIAITMTACGKFEAAKSKRMVDPRLEPYVQTFEKAYRVIANLSVQVGKIDPAWAGVCYGNSRVVISQDWFLYDLGPYNLGLEETVLHELGHCVLGLDHDDSILTSGPAAWCPTSIMFSYMISGTGCYETHREYYIRELGARAGLPVYDMSDILMNGKLTSEVILDNFRFR